MKEYNVIIISTNKILDITFNADTVKPAAVDPTPVVNTALGIIFEANLSNSDLPVPGSPTRSKCDSALVRIPVRLVSSNGLPPAKTIAIANFTQ